MLIAITTITPNTATIANIFNPCCLEGVVDGDSPGCVASSVDSTDCFAVLGCVVVVVSSISSNTILIVVSVSGSSVGVSILVDALYPGVIWLPLYLVLFHCAPWLVLADYLVMLLPLGYH